MVQNFNEMAAECLTVCVFWTVMLVLAVTSVRLSERFYHKTYDD